MVGVRSRGRGFSYSGCCDTVLSTLRIKVSLPWSWTLADKYPRGDEWCERRLEGRSGHDRFSQPRHSRSELTRGLPLYAPHDL